jgi:hypothetical protein
MMMMKQPAQTQTLFLLFRFVPLVWNKVFWLAQAVSGVFYIVCSLVLFIYIYLRGAKSLYKVNHTGFSFLASISASGSYKRNRGTERQPTTQHIDFINKC